MNAREIVRAAKRSEFKFTHSLYLDTTSNCGCLLGFLLVQKCGYSVAQSKMEKFVSRSQGVASSIAEDLGMDKFEARSLESGFMSRLNEEYPQTNRHFKLGRNIARLATAAKLLDD